MNVPKIACILLILLSIFCFYNFIESPRLLYAQEQNSNETIITIPKGSANPEVDITNLTPRQWYAPGEVTVNVNDTVRWVNNDTEPHTVTSGIGGGLNSLLSNSQGKPNGLFDSGLFASDNSISIKFNESGTYNYFCTVHPWMEGVVKVQNATSSIPTFPVDEFGNKIDDFPLYNFTDDKRIEIGLSWSPSSIITGQPANFIMDFFEFPENTRLHLWPYNFVVLQNGQEIYRTNGISQVGSSAQTFTFTSAGQAIIKIENADNKSSFVQFGTTVYKNPYEDAASVQNVSNTTFSIISPLTLVYVVYGIIIILPISLVAIIILYKKKRI